MLLLISRNVRRLRYTAGLTAKQAATKGGMTPRHWQKIEAAETNITVDTLAKLCIGLGVDAAELLREPPRNAESMKTT